MPDSVELEVNWVLKIGKYCLQRHEITEVQAIGYPFWGVVTFQHSNSNLPPYIAFTCCYQHWDALKDVLTAAGYLP